MSDDEEGNELGFDGTVCELLGLPVKEHFGNGVFPHSPSLPENEVYLNFEMKLFGMLP